MSIEELKRRIHRVNFRVWARLEDLRDQITRAAEDKRDNFPQTFYQYLSAALDVKDNEFASLPWHECVDLFYQVSSVNFPNSKLPIVTAIDKKKKPSKSEWDYDGRTWYLYSHMLASHYGWTLEYIGELDVDDVLALVQEILTSEQLEHEFEWGLSEIAYPYNKATKQNRFQPLQRPYWMLPAPKPIKNIRIKKSLLPQGLVINAEEEEERAKRARDKEANTG